MSVAGERNLCFRSVNNSCTRTARPMSVQGLLYLFFGSVCFLTVYANFCVIVTIICIRKFHTPTNYLILSLALGDLLVGFLTMPPGMVLCVDGCRYFGDVFCQVHTVIDHMLSTFSILHLSCISIDRYYAICHPLLYSRRIAAKTALIMSLTCWILCTLFGFLQIYVLNKSAAEENYPKYFSCQFKCVALVNATTLTAYSRISFYFPSTIIVCINIKIFMEAQRQACQIHITQCQAMKSGASISKRELKAVRSLAMVIGCFLVCWAPAFISANIYSYSDKRTPLYVVHTLWISYVNSFFSPLIYAFFYSSFRGGFKMIISSNMLT